MSDKIDIVERLRDWSEMPYEGNPVVDALLSGAEDSLAVIQSLRKQNEAYREALEKIERWCGEFPETGKFWENADGTMSDRPMQYSACFGSNGERDFMRQVARQALSIHTTEDKT